MCARTAAARDHLMGLHRSGDKFNRVVKPNSPVLPGLRAAIAGWLLCWAGGREEGRLLDALNVGFGVRRWLCLASPAGRALAVPANACTSGHPAPSLARPLVGERLWERWIWPPKCAWCKGSTSALLISWGKWFISTWKQGSVVHFHMQAGTSV